MRFLQIVSSLPSSTPPAAHDPDQRARAGKAIRDAIASGELLATGGLGKRATAAARIVRQGGAVTVEDPPQGEGWMAAGGYSLAEYAPQFRAKPESRSYPVTTP